MENLVERCRHWEEKRQQHIEQKRSEMVPKDKLEEDQILAAQKEKQHAPISLKKFIAKVETQIKDHNDKIAFLKQKEEEELKNSKHKPIEASVLLAPKSEGPAFSRLYNLHFEKKDKKDDKAEKKPTAKNAGAAHRGKPIQDALYEIADQQKLNLEAKKAKIAAEIDKREKSKASVPTENESSKYLIARINKEFDSVLQDMSQQEDWKMDTPIAKVAAGSVMTTLGYLTPNITEESDEFKTFEELWELLPKESDGVC